MSKEELLFCPLGGSGEIGMNMNLYAYGKEDNQKWIIVDMGVTFADDSIPGIDLIMPDPGFIIDKKDDLLGVVLTHAHEDHIGAVAHIWPELKCKLYATPFTAALITVTLALIIALLLAHRSRGWKVFRTVLFVPQVVSSAAIAMLWAAMFNAEYGLVNFLLDYIGFSDYKNHNWLGNIRTANAALIGFSLCYVGYFMVIMLAKTASISEDYYDAANIDGASQFQKDLHITAPLIKSTFFLCIILAVIFNLRQFEYVYLMTAGGPANKTQVLVVYIWNELTVQRLGRGNAAGVIMIAIGAILLLSLRKFLKCETYN